ncbi:MAG TPA: C45 family peptidase, partial [Tepidisphaeraceae bacterium]|nr:C45 family peptidase [Tepidisphaeraceae bacterium]
RNQLLPEHKAEIAALAAATGIDPGEMMLANCFLDMMPMTACSTIALPGGAAPDGVARFGRNLDFMSFDIADKYSVLMVVRPKDRYAFAAVSWPGLIGVLSGMNEHGLALANMEVDRSLRMPAAMPYTLLYRMVLERCKTVEEAIELLRKTPRQTANNLMLMDAEGNRAVVEITPEAVVVRRGAERAAVVSTNHQRGEDQDQTGRCWRYDTLNRTAKDRFGAIDVAAVEKMLGSVAQGKATLQSMVFEPANRVIYLAVGLEATKREYKRVDLKACFGQ